MEHNSIPPQSSAGHRYGGRDSNTTYAGLPPAPNAFRLSGKPSNEYREALGEIWAWLKARLKAAAGMSTAQRLKRLLIIGIFVAIIVVLNHYEPNINRFFAQHKQAIVDTPASWLVPIAVLVVLSFPPLFGHEFVLLFVGLIWDIGAAFGIAATGTLIGEVLCFVVFRHFLTRRATSTVSRNAAYGCIGKLMQEGDILVLALVRYSLVPGHIITSLASVVGTPLWKYIIAIILSILKPWVFVYFGINEGKVAVLELQDGDANDQAVAHQQSKSNHNKSALVCVFLLVSFVSVFLLYVKARRFYPEVREEMEACEAEASMRGGNPPLLQPVTVPSAAACQVGGG